MPRATSPWRRLTPFAARLVRSANWLTPNGSPASSGRVRPSRMISSGSTPSAPVIPASASTTWSAGYVSLPAGTGVCVVKIVFVRAAAMPSASVPPWARAASSEMNAAWPSLRCSSPGSIAERLERAHAADAEQDVLRQPPVGLADVEPRRDPAGRDVVLRPLGVEQEQRDAADVHAPDLGRHLEPAHGHGDGQRRAVGTRHQRGGQPLGIRVDPVLVLPAAGVDALAEVALAVQQPDRDERQRPVGRLLEDVAGERAEPAGVDRERLVDAELRAEVGDRVVRRRRTLGRGALEVPAHLGVERRDALEQRAVARGALQPFRGRLLQQSHRVLATAFPARGIDRREDVVAVGGPGPAVVVGEPRQRPQRLGHARGQGLGGAQKIVVSGRHRGAMMAASLRTRPSVRLGP